MSLGVQRPEMSIYKTSSAREFAGSRAFYDNILLATQASGELSQSLIQCAPWQATILASLEVESLTHEARFSTRTHSDVEARKSS